MPELVEKTTEETNSPSSDPAAHGRGEAIEAIAQPAAPIGKRKQRQQQIIATIVYPNVLRVGETAQATQDRDR